MSPCDPNPDISAEAVLRTLLMTDLVGGTKLVEDLGDVRAYKVAAQHDRAARDLLPRFDGREIAKTGGFLLLFDRPIDAVGYALAYHRALAALSDDLGVELQARVGIHLGEVLLRRVPAEDVARGAQPVEVEGLTRPLAARVLSLAQARQTLLTRIAFELARRAAVGKDLSGPEVGWLLHGLYRVEGFAEPLDICEVGVVGFAPLDAPRGNRVSDGSGTPAAEARPGRSRVGEVLSLRRNPFYHRQGIVDPRCFFGRADLVRSLLEMVASGQSCAVVGERRIGKSSLLAYLACPEVLTAHQIQAERTLAVVLDFLGLHDVSPAELLRDILDALELAARHPEAAETLRSTPEATFTELRRTLRKLRRQGFRVVLLCDEFELAVQNPRFDVAFFGALRALASEGVVFVTASRSNLLELEQYQSEETRRKVLGSPFFNIFAEFQVGPFRDHEVAELLAVSLDPTPIRFEREDVELLDRVAGRHPYFLQLAAYHLYAVLERSRRAAGKDAPERVRQRHDAVRAEVRREAAKIFRNQWHHSRMDERRVLAALALATREAARRPPLPAGVDDRTLARLERRGLIRGEGDRVTRAEPLLKSYWLFSEILTEWVLSHASGVLEEVTARGDLHAVPPALASSVKMPATERYTILEEIGHGGTGTVYKAWDEQLQRLVAVKVLDPAIRSSPEHLKRLLVEARTCAALHHPHIVVIHDVDTDDGILVQELMAGGSLRDLLEQMPVLEPADLRTLAEQLAVALGAAHGAGVIHRDLKPENVLLTARPAMHAAGKGPVLPNVKLGDFGTALRLDDLSQVGERLSLTGTLAYMAPEQMRGEGIGPAADVYALGVVLYEARHGERPPAGAQAAALAAVGADAGAWAVDAVIARCLAEVPRDRFQSAEALLAALCTGDAGLERFD